MNIEDWPMCECGQNGVNMWAGEGLCSPCTRKKLGEAEFWRRYRATRAPDGSWAGWESSLAAKEA